MITDQCFYSPTVQINKIVPTVTYHSHYRSQDDDQLQADKLAVSHYIVSCASSPIGVNSVVRTTSTCVAYAYVHVVLLVNHTSLILPLSSVLLSPIYPAYISLTSYSPRLAPHVHPLPL